MTGKGELKMNKMLFKNWVPLQLTGGRQYINFVHPKGLRNLKGPDDPKIAFYKTIKTVESDLKEQDPSVTLNSFIISNTRLPEVTWWNGGMTKEEFEERHVFFQHEDKDTYIAKLLARALGRQEIWRQA